MGIRPRQAPPEERAVEIEPQPGVRVAGDLRLPVARRPLRGGLIA